MFESVLQEGPHVHVNPWDFRVCQTSHHPSKCSCSITMINILISIGKMYPTHNLPILSTGDMFFLFLFELLGACHFCLSSFII
jgi:hypothetical protein